MSGEPSPTPMETGDRSSAKKARVESSPWNKVKQKAAGDEEAARGGRALLVLGGDAAAAVAAAREEVVARIDRDMLRCPLCTLPLKPPIFQCGVGHMACGSCHGQFPTNQCHSCDGNGNGGGGGAAYAPFLAMDAFVSKVLVPCPHEAYGCRASVAYYEAPDHHRSCRFAPCFCPAPGCGHFTSPARLAEHFSSHHAWPVTEVDYAKPCKLAVPGPQDKLVLVGKADGCVFLVSLCAQGAATAVSLVCVRACGDAAAGAPQYRWKLWAEVAGNFVLLTSMVASSDLASGFPATDQGIFLAVPPKLLHDESGEPSALMVRIDQVGASAASARSRSPSATPPSSLPRRMLQ